MTHTRATGVYSHGERELATANLAKQRELRAKRDTGQTIDKTAARDLGDRHRLEIRAVQGRRLEEQIERSAVRRELYIRFGL